MQEAQFNRNVEKALQRIEDNIARHKSCTTPDKCGNCILLTNTLKQVANLDSIIQSDLSFYGINMNYEYGIVDIKNVDTNNPPKGTYFSNNLSDKIQRDGFELKIKFPSKRDFILAQIGFIFISSIILVILVTVSFILIYRYYRRERLLSDQIRDFVNNMTHEFKTPLTNIGFANSMISKSPVVEGDSKLSSYTSIIRTEQIRLKERVDELLKTTHSQTIIPVSKEILDLSMVIEDVIESFQAQIDEKRGDVKLIKAGDDFKIEGNIDQLHIVFGNLIDNAIKYSEAAPKIEIHLKSTVDKLLVTVTDNGIGIPGEHLKSVFEKFYRVPKGNTHDNKGFGLGLFHVKSIIDQMGGKIEATSSKGNGTSIIIELDKIKSK